MALRVYGSYGEIRIDNVSGRVLEVHPYDGYDGEYDDIARFDIDECRMREVEQGLERSETFDIVRIGFWNKDGVYTSPNPDPESIDERPRRRRWAISGPPPMVITGNATYSTFTGTYTV